MYLFTSGQAPLLLVLGLGLSLNIWTQLSSCETTTDADDDGYSEAQGDCNDAVPEINPGAAEICDGLDNDCDADVDEGVQLLYYPDADHDGYGANSTPVSACSAPAGYVSTSSDCNDAAPDIYPGATEVCDGLDNSCDAVVDEGFQTLYYPDADQDGFGDGSKLVTTCTAPAGYLPSAGDCNDADPDVHPGATELCDGLDGDCNGPSPEDARTRYFRDADGDGVGSRLEPVLLLSCAVPAGYVTLTGDCDDVNPARAPGLSEVCNGSDDNCDGRIDEGLSLTYSDQDGDGFGVESTGSCAFGTGRVSALGDCDDARADVHPGAADANNDSLDNDCGGSPSADPHLGYALSPSLTVQAALDQAPVGSTVWVGPGTRTVSALRFHGKALALRASHGPTNTVLDANAQDRAVVFDGHETSATRLDGFRIQNGTADLGGAILIQQSNPTLSRCEVRGSTATRGGGVALVDSQAVLEQLLITGNSTSMHCESNKTNVGDEYYPTYSYTFECDAETGHGAGLYVSGGSPVLKGLELNANQTVSACGKVGTEWYDGASDTTTHCYRGSGGGTYGLATSMQASELYVANNQALNGAGLALVQSELTLIHSVLTGNQGHVNSAYHVWYSGYSTATVDLRYSEGTGAGLYAEDATLSLNGVQVVSNRSLQNGGGAGLLRSVIDARDVLWLGNEAKGSTGYSSSDYSDSDYFIGGQGGGLWLEESQAELSDEVMVANLANRGGGLYTSSTYLPNTLSLTHSLIAGNTAFSTLSQSCSNKVEDVCESIPTPPYTWCGPQSVRYCNPIELFQAQGGGIYADAVDSAMGWLYLEANQSLGLVGSNSSQGEKILIAGRGSAAALTNGRLGHSAVIGNSAQSVSDGASRYAGAEGTVYTQGGALSNNLLAYNDGGNLVNDAYTYLLFNDFYLRETGLNQWGEPTNGVNVISHPSYPVPPHNLTVEPQLLIYRSDGWPADAHLASGSPLIDKGDSGILDPDGTRCDIGLFSGMEADLFDADGDGFPVWYWPGAWASAPAGVDNALFDRQDRNPLQH